jgi:hypothetical protein
LAQPRPRLDALHIRLSFQCSDGRLETKARMVAVPSLSEADADRRRDGGLQQRQGRPEILNLSRNIIYIISLCVVKGKVEVCAPGGTYSRCDKTIVFAHCLRRAVPTEQYIQYDSPILVSNHDCQERKALNTSERRQK